MQREGWGGRGGKIWGARWLVVVFVGGYGEKCAKGKALKPIAAQKQCLLRGGWCGLCSWQGAGSSE
jgi:hypothetical protein